MIARKIKVDDKNKVLIAGDTEVNSGLPLKDGGGFTHWSTAKKNLPTVTSQSFLAAQQAQFLPLKSK